MVADLNLIDSISFGKVKIEQRQNGCFFRRTSEKTQAEFGAIQEEFGRKCDSSSCINFDFYTDSTKVELEYCDVCYGSTREFYYFDVYVNGALTMHYGEESHDKKAGRFTVELDGKLNRVTIYSPMLSGYTLKEIAFDDGAKIIPVVKKCRILALGDSITHGYDECYPSFGYANIVGRFFDAEVINQAIGGADAVAATIDGGLNPDYITVAYGTNDWSHKEYLDFYNDYHEFVKTLKDTYPDATVFLISPIYRADKQEATAGDFSVAKDVVSSAADKYGCVFIDGLTLAPHLPEFLKKDKVHPNDMGSYMYALGLIEILRQYIK